MTMASESEGDGGYTPPLLLIPAAPPAVLAAAADPETFAAPAVAVPMSPEAPPPPAEEAAASPAKSNDVQSADDAAAEDVDEQPSAAAAAAAEGGDSAADTESAAVEEEAVPPPPATPTSTPAATSSGGLFAGLSMSSPDGKAEPAPATPNAEDEELNQISSTNTNNKKKEETAGKKEGGSRASTPVHSNISPPPTPSSAPPACDITPGASTTPVLVRPAARAGVGAPPPPPMLTSPASVAAAGKVITAGGAAVGGAAASTGATAAGKIRLSTLPSAKIPHPDTALRLLRKFHAKASPFVPRHAGGTRPSTWFGWVFGDGAEAAAADKENADGDLEAFKGLCIALEVGGEDPAVADGDAGDAVAVGGAGGTEGDLIVESILGRSGDSPAKARRSLSSFVELLTTWARSSAEAMEVLQQMEKEGKNTQGMNVLGSITPELIGMGIDAASALVAHGCLDDLYLRLSSEEEGDVGEDGSESGGEEGEEVGAPSLVKKAVNLLVESICIADLSSERTELSALKFLLTTGCRMTAVAPVEGSTPEPMLRGTHLLQTVRVCSQIYLHTEIESNKTTAKAALQQLVITVFVRLERSIEKGRLETAVNSAGEDDGEGEKAPKSHHGRKRTKSESSVVAGGAVFPTQDHRDAYLVLRSLCKLSMQTAAVRAPTQVVMVAAGEGAAAEVAPPPTPAAVVQDDSSYDPALESRILALQLLLHILRHSSAPSILQAGPQFHYAVRQYLCTSLLKNTTSLDTTMVELSLRLFVPLIRNFRSLLKTEIEAFVTNVFFVILDSKNSTVQHKLLVVTLFEEICSDATTLAEIFLNYDCDLSAVDLFSRIINALGKVARVGLGDATGTSGGGSGTLQFVAGAGAARAEMVRLDHRELRLAAMKALRQVLASLHSSIVTPVGNNLGDISVDEVKSLSANGHHMQKQLSEDLDELHEEADASAKKTLVEMYDSKKKRREEESQAALKFNQKPTAGLKFAAECGHVDIEDPTDVARYLLQNKDIFDKRQIGEYLGREKEWMDGFALKVLRAYGDAMDFKDMEFSDAIRYYLSGFRLPGEAQKIDRIMEVFAARYTDQNSTTFPTADCAFILAFSIIMLNTDLHNPAIKEDRKMTIVSFTRMNSGVCDGGDFPDDMLIAIFNRIQREPISLKEDDDARESAGISKDGSKNGGGISALSTASEFFFGSHYIEQDKTRDVNYQKEGDQIVRDTESMLRRRRKAPKHPASAKKSMRDSMKKAHAASVKFVGTADSGLKDEYVTPMFDVAWGTALAVFSTSIESANGTDGILASIATDEEMDHAVDNASLAIEVSLNGFQLAICIASLCGNDTARDAYVRALYNFTLLGSGHLLADRHLMCVQSLLRLGRDDGELLGVTWEHIFRALTEIYRLHQVWEGMARNERKEIKARKRAERRAEREAMREAASRSSGDESATSSADMEDGYDSDTSSEMSDYNDVHLEEEMDKRMIDESNAMFIHDMIPLDLVDSIFQRSTSLSRRSLKDFVYQLCRVSRMEISGYGGHVGSDANDIDLTNDHYMKHHALVSSDSRHGGLNIVATQPAIYSLEKLVEVTHFNMESRPRLIFADIWGTISTHLTSTALHEEPAVAMYAVDSLRQLALQFLNREELGVFEFQRRFLKSLETIMGRSTHVSVKELLLSSVEQLISIYGFGDGSGEGGKSNHQGTLRSGWRSVLAVLGTAGLDKNDAIARQGFKLLNEQIQQCMLVCNKEGSNDGKQLDSLLSEYFVDLVNTLLLYISGPSEELSSKSIDSLIQLSDVLAEGKVPLSSTRRKAPTAAPGGAGAAEAGSDLRGNDELELWWPMLLGLSQTMGDRRLEVRVKGLGTLLNIINKHFFPSSSNGVSGSGDSSSPQHGDLQTMQLIFRGILVPALENEEMDGNSTSGFAPELLPAKFVHFITAPPSPEDMASVNSQGQHDWINTTFEHLMDGCISICLRSLEAFNDDSLVEEVLAMLNSCLLSDSGHLAVKGLRRLQQFVSKDMELKDITDDTWAAVSHMLFRVLSIRGLPSLSIPEVEGATEQQKEHIKQEHAETMNEFVREQKFFSNRRYIGCNAAMVIGSLLTDNNIVESIGVHWYVFLTSGLGKGIRDWERAAEIMDSKVSQKTRTTPSPPHYLENILYARRWMTKFLLALLTQRDVSTLESPPCQHVVKEETESLLRTFLAKESNDSSSAIEMRNISKMISDILECFNTLDDDKIAVSKGWLSPVLSACIQTNNVTIRTSVQILLTRLLKGGGGNIIQQRSGSVANGDVPSQDDS